MTRSGTSNSARALVPALPAALVVLGGFAWPLARLAAGALGPSTSEDGRTALWVVLRAPPYRRALLGSIGLSAGVALAAVALCLPAGLALGKGRFRGRSLLRAAFAVPLSLSGVVIGFLAVAMLGNAGALPSLLHAPSLAGSAYGLGGMALAYLYFEVPRAMLTLEATLASVDDGLLEAARTLGARPHQVLRLVLLPLAAPALRSAFGVTFVASLGSFGVALILAARFPVLPVELYRAATGTLDDALVAAMALWLAAAGGAVLALCAQRGKAQ